MLYQYGKNCEDGTGMAEVTEPLITISIPCQRGHEFISLIGQVVLRTEKYGQRLYTLANYFANLS